MTTLQAYDKQNGANMAWVAIPLELIDWMSIRFKSPFTEYLASLDPYASMKLHEDKVVDAVEELSNVLRELRLKTYDVPAIVDLFGQYGNSGARQTLVQTIEFFNAVSKNDWKVVSIGD